MELSWICNAMPIGKPRPRVTSRGTFLPQPYRDYQEELAATALEAFARHLAAGHAWDAGLDMSLDVTFVVPDRRRRDVDNLAGGVMDALNGIAWKDDSQVVQLAARRLYMPRSGMVSIVIRTIDE